MDLEVDERLRTVEGGESFIARNARGLFPFNDGICQALGSAWMRFFGAGKGRDIVCPSSGELDWAGLRGDMFGFVPSRDALETTTRLSSSRWCADVGGSEGEACSAPCLRGHIDFAGFLADRNFSETRNRTATMFQEDI